MIFVVVKEKNVPIAKEVYAGDVSKVQESLNQRLLKNADLTFDVFDDSQESLFNAAQIIGKPPPEQTNWNAAKANGPDAAFSFLGKRLGLE